MMRRRWLGALGALALAWAGGGEARAQAAGGTGPGACADWVRATGMPSLASGAGGEVLLCRTGYLVSFNPARRTPNWVLEVLTPERFARTVTREDRRFQRDPDVKELSASDDDYVARPGARAFDRGHMSPAADNSWLEEAMRDSFYLTNVAPQHGPKMNRGIWKDLEARARDWTLDRRRLLVFSGPIYGAAPSVIGESKVAVPEGFFKVIYDPATGRVMAFRFDNKPYDKPDLAPNRRSVRDVEQETGIRFFPDLPARARRVLTTQVGPMWR